MQLISDALPIQLARAGRLEVETEYGCRICVESDRNKSDRTANDGRLMECQFHGVSH